MKPNLESEVKGDNVKYLEVEEVLGPDSQILRPHFFGLKPT